MKNCRRPRKCSDSNEFLNVVYHYITPITSENNEFPFFLSLPLSRIHIYVYNRRIHSLTYSLFLSIILISFPLLFVFVAQMLSPSFIPHYVYRIKMMNNLNAALFVRKTDVQCASDSRFYYKN